MDHGTIIREHTRVTGNIGEIGRRSVYYFLASALNIGTFFILSIILSWFLGRDGLGEFSVCYTAAMIGALLAEIGTDSLILRSTNLSDNDRSRRLSAILLLRSISSSLGAIAVYGVFVVFLLPAESDLPAFSASLLVIPRSIGTMLENLMKADGRRRPLVFVTAGFNAAQLGSVVSVLVSKGNLHAVFQALLVIEILKTAVLFIANKQSLLASYSVAVFGTNKYTGIIREGLPFAMIGTLAFVSSKLDLFVLTSLRGSVETGIYSAADRFLMLGHLMAASLFSSVLPVFSSMGARQALRRTVTTIVSYALVVAGIVVILLNVFAPSILGLTFRFQESVPILRILSWAILPLVINTIVGAALFSAHREIQIMFTFGAASALSLTLNLLFVPEFGATASAYITILIELFLLVNYLRLFKTTTKVLEDPIGVGGRLS